MQNNTLRIATGCVKMTNIDHLHEESQMLSVRKHNELLMKQYLIACYLPSHPNYHIVMNNPTPRRIRHDCTTYDTDINHIIPTIVDLQSVREAQRSLHQTTVSTTTDELSHNRVINRHPPPIAENERQLSRTTRTILVQLRSGLASSIAMGQGSSQEP